MEPNEGGLGPEPGAEPKAAGSETPGADPVTPDDRQDAAMVSRPPVPDLRVARILEAKEHPNADRLLVMRIDLGAEERQIVAGIRGHYQPEELPGKSIVVVANLQHAKLRGEWSQGMLLAAENEEGRLGLLLAPEAEPGTPLRPRGGADPDPEITFPGFHENTLLAGEAGVTVNGGPLDGARLTMDRGVFGKLR